MFKNLFVPNKENGYLPKIIEGRLLVLYAFISVIVFLLVCPSVLRLDRLLADLTQDLIIEEINPIREGEGYLRLSVSEKLNSAAQMKAEDMLERQYFDHIGPEGETPWSWLREVDYNYAAAAENLAIHASSPKSLVRAWLNSPTHAKNILNGYFTEVGVGIATGEMEGRKTTVVVMFLGREVPKDIYTTSSIVDDFDIKKPETLVETSLNVSPEEPVLAKTVEEDVLYEDNVIMAVRNINAIKENVPQRTNTKLYLINELPSQARLGLTLFFNIILLWGIVTLLFVREGFFPRAFNSLIVLALLFFIWIPEIL